MSKDATQCSGCKVAFTDGQAFFSSPDGDESSLCETCARARVPKCEACGEPAIGQIVKLDGKTYHAACLKCVSCSQTFENGSCRSMGKGLFCSGCAEDVRKLIGLAMQLDEQGDRKGAAEIAQQLVDKGIDVPEDLLRVDDEALAAAAPMCAMCEETIKGKCGSIMGKSPVCLSCGESVQRQVEQHRELSQRGEYGSALKIAQDLAAKGLDVPEELLKERLPAPSCAMCTNPIVGTYAEVGDKMICESCHGIFPDQLRKIAQLAKAGDIDGAVNIAQGLKAKGLQLPKPSEDMLEKISQVPTCISCSKRIEGKCAQVGDGYLCFDCGQIVNADMKQAQTLVEQGDTEGAAAIARSLRARGIPLPDALMEGIPKAVLAAAAATAPAPTKKSEISKGGVATENGHAKAEVENPPRSEVPAAGTGDQEPAKVPKMEEPPEGVADEPTVVAGSGANAAKALSPKPTAKPKAKPASTPVGKAKAAPRSTSPAPKAQANSSAPKAQAKRIHKEVIGARGSGGSLTASNVFVRIRPLAISGGHAEDGTSLSKVLDSWDDESVTIGTQYMFSKGETRYTFPRQVLGPECTQQEFYDATSPEIVEAFSQRNGYNVLFLAYGQTGTGKTHTMFGTDDSLKSPVFHADWGILPRVCAMTFDSLNARDGVVFHLTASAIEFYMGGCQDLLGNRAYVEIDSETLEPLGRRSIELKEAGDLMPVLAQVLANRTTRSTKMNAGSSRSHAAIILELMQLDIESQEYVKTTFTLVDLAGAERPDKTGETRMSGGMCMEFLPKLLEAKAMGYMSEEKFNSLLPTGAQALCINHELFSLGTEVLKATEQHKKGKPYAAPKALATPTVQYLSALLHGKALLSMCVCLSPAGQNGWETWFSLQYGTDLSSLRAPVQAQKPQNFEKLCKSAESQAKKMQAEFASAPMNKYYAGRKTKAENSASFLEKLQMLKDRM